MSANRVVVNNIIINTHNVTAEKETEVYFHNKSRDSGISSRESVLQGQGTESPELLDVQRGTVTH
jgi:hypothetical protein